MIAAAMAAGPCEDKARLLSIYTEAATKYSQSLQQLREKLPFARKYEYEQSRTFTENYRKLAEEAREALERHIAEHGC